MVLRNTVWPVTASVLLHASVVAFVLLGWDPTPTPRTPTPQYIEAKLVELKPKAQRATRAEPKQVQKIDLTKRQREQELAEQRARERKQRQEQQRREEADKAEQQRQAEEARRRAEQEKQAELERQRQRAEAFEEALEEERGLILEDAYATQAQSYIQAIQRRIEQHWSRPSSARNNMEALLSIQLVPTGRVVNVSVIKSSGNAAFDRSAEQAVRQVEVFPEVQEMPPEVFERYYRRFNLLFKPQDLRQ